MSTLNLLSLREHFFQPALSVSTGTTIPKDNLDPPDALVHFMNRASFGIRDSELQMARAMGYRAFVEAQLNPNPADAAAIEANIASNLPSVGMSGEMIVTTYPATDNQDVIALAELRAATTLRQLGSPNQLFEVMVEFWTNHFAVEHNMGFMRQAKTLDDRDIRRNAMGKFKDLLNANARSPAMLYYLDNYVNTKAGVQENYGREIMELHTLGVDGGYTEDDVKAVARAFTGWTFVRNRLAFVFVAANHDTNEKVVLGQRLPANRGIEDGQQVIDILVAHPATAKFIATKLVRRFVSDTPPQKLVDTVAQVFINSGGDIKEMLRTIFFSVDFMASADLKYKRPQEFMLSALRASNATVSGTTVNRSLTTYFDAAGQVFSSWAGPDGYPDVATHWINTTAWLGRWNAVFSLLEKRFDPGISIDARALAGDATTPAMLVDNLSQRIVRRKLSVDDRDQLLVLAGAGQLADGTLPPSLIAARAQEVLSVLLCSRYFHYR